MEVAFNQALGSFVRRWPGRCGRNPVGGAGRRNDRRTAAGGVQNGFETPPANCPDLAFWADRLVPNRETPGRTGSAAQILASIPELLLPSSSSTPKWTIDRLSEAKCAARGSASAVHSGPARLAFSPSVDGRMQVIRVRSGIWCCSGPA